MPYLSMVKMSRLTKRSFLLFEPQHMHKAICSTLPQPAGRYMFRIDKEGTNLSALVQSFNVPDWSKARFDGIEVLGPKIISCPVDGTFEFKMRVNPIYYDLKGKRREIGTKAGKEKWLHDVSQKNGFKVKINDIIDDGQTFFIKGDGNEVVFNSTTFQGLLQIESAEKFKAVMENGIGRQKAYGCGLISLGQRIF